jgi:hypothetical protein
MLNSTECRQRADQKIAEAERYPRRKRKLLADAECWLVVADRVERLEVGLGGWSISEADGDH